MSAIARQPVVTAWFPPPWPPDILDRRHRAEIDLVLEMPDRKLWAVEIKRGLAPKLDKGFHHAREDINPERSFVVYSGDDRYPKSEGIEVIGLGELASLLAT